MLSGWLHLDQVQKGSGICISGKSDRCSDLLQDAAKGRLVLVYEVEQVGGEVPGRAQAGDDTSERFADICRKLANPPRIGASLAGAGNGSRVGDGGVVASPGAVEYRVSYQAGAEDHDPSGVRRDLCGSRRESTGGSARAGADRRRAQAAAPGWKVLGH